jgi:O-antigen ligase
VKWAALAILLATLLPLCGWLRRNPRNVPKIWVLVGFLPFGIGVFHLYMAVISWAGWGGYVKGLEISVLDILALALYLSLPRGGPALPFRLSMALYFFAVLLSIFDARVPMAALFYAWQLARMFLVYTVVAKASAQDQRVVPALLTGMALGLCLEAGDAVWERFVGGVLQAGGTMGHQNLLGLTSHFALFPWIALLLAGERGWRPVVAPLAGLIVAALTVSRATVGLVGGGFIVLFGLSAKRRWTPRKAMLLCAGAGAACLLAPFILSSFQQRFSEQVQGSNYDERAAFEKAAALMISDHPMGVGANNYVMVANIDGYNNRAGVASISGSDSANVHNIYYLVAAETGYVGLVTFALVLLQPLVVAFRASSRNPRDRRGDLLLGLGLAMLIVYIHSYFEWVFITYPPQYMFAINAGLVAGLAQQLGYWGRSQLGNRVAVSVAIASVEKMARN